MRHGWGTQEWGGGGRYVGEFKDGLRQGLGRFEEPDGLAYEGVFDMSDFESTVKFVGIGINDEGEEE